MEALLCMRVCVYVCLFVCVITIISLTSKSRLSSSSFVIGQRPPLERDSPAGHGSELVVAGHRGIGGLFCRLQKPPLSSQVHVHALDGTPRTVAALVLLSRVAIDYAAVDARRACRRAALAGAVSRLLAIIEGLNHPTVGRGLGQEVVLHGVARSLVALHEARLRLTHQVVLRRGALSLAALGVEEPRARRMGVRGEVVSAAAARPDGSITVELLLAAHRTASVGEAAPRSTLVGLVEGVCVAVSRRLPTTRDGRHIAAVGVGLADGADVQLRVQGVVTGVATDI